MTHARPTAWAALLFLNLASPLDANEDAAAEVRTELGEIQAKDEGLQDIGWRLVSGNAAYCDRRHALTERPVKTKGEWCRLAPARHPRNRS